MISRRVRSRPVWRRPGGGIALIGLLLGLLVAIPGYAYADMPLSPKANVLVLQSIGLIANQAPAATVAERIQDAVDAPDRSGTDLPKVEQALSIVEQSPAGAAGTADMERARQLLVGAIAIRFATGYGSIPEPGTVGQAQSPYASGDESGTTAVLDELVPPRGVSDWGDVVLLGLAVLAVAAGLVLARRWRPHTSLHDLRRRTAPQPAPAQPAPAQPAPVLSSRVHEES